MLYPHITNAQVDVANAMWSLLRFNAGVPAWIRAMLPYSVTPWYEFLVDREWRAPVRTAVDDLNRAITNGVPRNAKVKVVPAPGLTQADFQYTIAGGCPHPSPSGHDKLYRALAAAYATIP
jgi:hypothetical protein